jgi:hypothetical protein
MEKPINFADNIFMLNVRIRMIRDLLSLDTDPAMFVAKTMDDLDFIDRRLNLIMQKLNENTRFINRDEQLHNLYESEGRFLEILDRILESQGPISALTAPALGEKAKALRQNSLARRGGLGESLQNFETPTDEPLVSQDELAELLRGF